MAFNARLHAALARCSELRVLAAPGPVSVSLDRCAVREIAGAPAFHARQPHQGVRRRDFLINGRFSTQPVTGVQRYAREVVRHLDVLLMGTDRAADLVVPRGARHVPKLGAIRCHAAGIGSGHGWEQLVLPVLGGGPLLSLGNTGPILRGRQIVCIHDLNVMMQPGSYRWAFRTFYRLLQPLLVRRAAMIATVSHASAAAIANHFGIERRSIAVLPNGHEHALAWGRVPCDARSMATDRPFVLLLGSRARHKNLDLMLRLAPALDARNIDLVIAGGAGGVFSGARTPTPPNGNVHWLGSVSDGELADLFSRALCLAFPSWTEGFGLPIVEAMAWGCPVIASDRASMPEVCGAAALLAAPDDDAAWLRHVVTLAESATLRRELVERGSGQIRRFSWPETAKGYLALLEGLA